MDDASVFLDALAVAASDAMTKSCATRMTPSCRLFPRRSTLLNRQDLQTRWASSRWKNLEAHNGAGLGEVADIFVETRQVMQDFLERA
jgi:hypothetical protein